MAENDLAGKFLESSQRGAAYVISRQREDGVVGSGFILNYYKSTWALASTGHVVEAWRLLDWIKENAQTEPGQFHHGDDRPELLRSSTYRNTIIMMSALMLGRFDVLSTGAVENLKKYQHPGIGAFYGEQHYDENAMLNTNHTGMTALLCLHLGLTEMAEKAGDYILKHLADQPDPGSVFYINTDTKGNLVTDFPDEMRAWRVVDYANPEGHFWAIGTGAMFLAHLFAHTGREKYIEGARSLLRLSYKLAPGFEYWASADKIAWGAARVYAFTREQEFKELAEKIGRKCFLDLQKEDGSWGPFFLRMGADGKGYELPVLELTSEFTLVTSELAKCLCS